jgi:hypothetical protein
MESLGRYADEDGERDLYLAWVPSLEEWRLLAADSRWRETVEDSPAGFALFLACDAEGLSADLIGDFASYCIQHGLFWVSIWGPDCERVHDIFDEVDIDQEAEPGTVMSTWHDDESLEEALVLFWDAFPSEDKLGGPARIAVSVASHDWLEQLRADADHYLHDPDDDEL